MKKAISLTLVFLMLILLVGCSKSPADPVTDPSADADAGSSPTEPTEPSTDPPTTDPTQPTTEPVATDPTEAETSEPRQEGMRLSSEQLAYYTDLFSSKTNYPLDKAPNNYYNLALMSTFASAQDLSLNVFFSQGFSNEWSKPITDAERNFYAKAMGYDEYPLDLYRLPKELVEYVLEYYFCEEMDTSQLVYNSGTKCYYVPSYGAPQYPGVSFTDGYFDETTGLISLYYLHFATGEEFIMTIQSKVNMGQSGYYIISNFPIL